MIIANFSNGERTKLVQTGLWQYDYGQVLRIQGLALPAAVEIHFSTQQTGGESVTRIGTTRDGVTDVVIPDSVLEKPCTTDYYIYAFIYLTDETSGQTEYKITMAVKARPKPEAFDRPEDGELFREAIAVVNESAGRAEDAEKSAEAWAHGREDCPEKEQDNAKYYADLAAEDAKQTNADLEAVGKLKESVDSTAMQVSENLKQTEDFESQAQTAAGNALLSEQKAKESENAATEAGAAAEAAEAQAELFAGQTEEDKNTVEQAKTVVIELGQKVAEDKSSVESTVGGFELLHQQAVADVNNAGQTQTERVQDAGRSATSDVDAARQKAMQDVKNEGEEQVSNVQDAAAEIIADRDQIETNRQRIGRLGFCISEDDNGLDIVVYEEEV